MSSFSPPSADVIRPSSIWIANLLFQRHNRSLKYTEDGSFLIMFDSFADFGQRLFRSFGWLLLFSFGILLNFLVLFLSIRKSRRQAYHQKFQFLMGGLAVCNIVLAVGLLSSTFLIDVFYDVDSFDTLLRLARPRVSSLWHFAKFLILTELIDNFLVAQQLVLLLASLDRYLTLFARYSSNAKPTPLFALISAIPFGTALILLDPNLLRLWISDQSTNLIRLLSLLCPLLLSLVFCCCSLFGLLRLRPPPRDQLSLSLSLFLLLSLDSFAKFGVFLRLLNANFSIRISLESREYDAQLQSALSSIYSISFFLLMISPLSHALITLTFVHFYRRKILGLFGRPIWPFARRKPKLDYSCETVGKGIILWKWILNRK